MNRPDISRNMLIAAIGAVVLLLGVLLFNLVILDALVLSRITGAVEKQSGGSYRLTAGSLEVDLAPISLTLSDLTISPDSLHADSSERTNRLHGTLHADQLTIGGAGISNFLFQNKLSVEQLILVNPRLELRGRRVNDQQEEAPADSTASSQQSPSRALEVGSVALQGGSVTWMDSGEDPSRFGVYGISISSSALRLPSDSSSRNPVRALATDLARRLEFRVDSTAWQPSPGLYTLSTGPVALLAADSTLSVSNFAFTPRLSRYEHMSRFSTETTWYRLFTEQIQADGVDFQRFVEEQYLAIANLGISKSDLLLYRDKRLPEPIREEKKLPREALASLPFPVAIDRIMVGGSDVVYELHPEGAASSAQVHFNGINAHITNITNASDRIANQPVMHAKASTYIMDDGLLELDITFPLDAPDSPHTVSGLLQPMDLRRLNPLFIQAAGIRINTLTLHELAFEFDAGSQWSRGVLDMHYEDLKVELVNNIRDRGGLGKRVTSAVANTFVLKKHNRGKKRRSGTIRFRRVEHKSVFHYWWKSLLSGIKESVGI